MADSGERWELAVTVPPVEEVPRVLVVRCGETVFEVKEFGINSWAIWVAGEDDRVAGGNSSYTFDKAREEARVRAVRKERRRLLHDALGRVLDEDEAHGGESCG